MRTGTIGSMRIRTAWPIAMLILFGGLLIGDLSRGSEPLLGPVLLYAAISIPVTALLTWIAWRHRR